MNYVKKVWKSKEIIKAKDLNHIEDGIYNEEQRAKNAESEISQAITSEYTRAIGAEGDLGNAISQNTSAIQTLNGNDTVVGSVDYKIAQASLDFQPRSLVMSTTLSAGSTSVTFTDIPTSGNNLIDFYAEGGACYTAINTSTAGQITLTYEAESTARTICCEIREA